VFQFKGEAMSLIEENAILKERLKIIAEVAKRRITSLDILKDFDAVSDENSNDILLKIMSTLSKCDRDKLSFAITNIITKKASEMAEDIVGGMIIEKGGPDNGTTVQSHERDYSKPAELFSADDFKK
jgi:hypothetical protein